ncbi:MAG TPA: M48 family metalloprotease, partial [Candidatus Wallbacteria bacterium]|nr:M48 family metalloprotease [Candidatus Wallbacteria bacterium]
FDPFNSIAARAESGDEGMSKSDELYERYKNEPENSAVKAELYQEYLRECSKNKKNESGSVIDKTSKHSSDDAVNIAYEKYKNAPAGTEKNRLYDEYLKIYRENSNAKVSSKKENEDEKSNDGVITRNYSTQKTDKKSSPEKKTYQNGSDLENAKAKSDEAYEKYRSTPAGSSEKHDAYVEYQKAYREYLAKKAEPQKLETASAKNDQNGRSAVPGKTSGPLFPVKAIAPGVTYLADTPNTPIPQISGGGGGGNIFKKAFRKLEQSTEMLIGVQTCAALELLYGVNKDADLNARLNRVATRIAAVSERRDLNYKFKIMNMKEVNAFAVPGGTIYVTRALLDFISSDSELASVLSHEMGHQVGRHSIKAFEKAMMIDYFIRNSKMGVVRNNKQALEIANAFMSLKYSRDNEMEADRYAFKYSTMAGYNPYGGVKFFEKLKNKYEPEKTPAFMRLISTHPSTHDRLIEAQNMVGSYIQANPQWQNGYAMLPK